MYLVHTELQHSGSALLTAAAAHAVAQVDGVEHASVHPDARPYPVLALYARARSVTEAAGLAAQAWHTAAAREGLGGWSIVRIRAYRIGSPGDQEEVDRG
ncbi:hypothetical protein [Streptomyces sp. NPDC047061]|uniref:hypothetical protein n=1 Tax=Streptomyces sp. NPDC047061 TaxID=3154605 RepID=UPI00340BE601